MCVKIPATHELWSAPEVNRLSALLLTAGLSLATAAAVFAAPSDDVAQRMTALSVRQEVAESDPRVTQTRKLLDKAVKLTHEDSITVAAACSRYVGHLYDSAHIEATPLELLEALVSFGKPGAPMQDSWQAYAAARKAASSGATSR